MKSCGLFAMVCLIGMWVSACHELDFRKEMLKGTYKGDCIYVHQFRNSQTGELVTTRDTQPHDIVLTTIDPASGSYIFQFEGLYFENMYLQNSVLYDDSLVLENHFGTHSQNATMIPDENLIITQAYHSGSFGWGDWTYCTCRK